MSKILDQWGRPIEREVLDEPQTARIAHLTNTYLTPALNGLTPAGLAAALQAADNGDLTAQHRIFSDMEERDAHIKSEMDKRKLAILDLDWDIVPPRGASVAEKKHAEWVQEVLEDAVDPIEDLLLALMDGVGHGFAATELEWRKEGAELLPAFFPRPQEWFRLDSTRSEIRLIDASVDGAKLRSFGWVWHSHGKAKTGYGARLGIHRTLVWPFIYKAYSVSDFAEFLETYGLPFIVGKYHSTAKPEERSSLWRAVASLGHDARAIMPADMQIELLKATTTGDGSTHMAMVDWAERSESKVILGQTTSAEAKATGLGSGIADAHADVRRDIRNADARQIAATITRDLIYPLIALNRGGIDGLRRCPRLVFDTGEAEDLAAYADALPKLVGVGFKVPRSWAQEKLRIPEPQTDEDVLAVAGAPQEDPLGGNTPPAPPALPAKVAANSAELPTTEPIPTIPDQAALDAALEAIPPETMQRLMAPIIEPVIAALEGADGFEAALAILAAQYPGMDSGKLENLLAQAMFAAELWGRQHTQE